MPTLHATLYELAQRFAHDVVRALLRASLDDLTAETRKATHAPKPRRTRRPPRRSQAELERIATQIVAIVLKGPEGIKAEDLKRAMGVKPGNVGAKVFTKPLAVALKSKRIQKSGRRRGTVYKKQ